VIKGTFEQFGGAERDLLNNLPAWTKHFEVTLASLNLPQEARERLDAVDIPYLTPVRPFQVPRGAWAEMRALASRRAATAWTQMLDLTEQVTGLREVIANIDYIHLTSGVGSLEITGLIPKEIEIHYHCLEPHRGLYEDVLHREIDGTPKRSLSLTHFLLGKQRRRDRRYVEGLSKRGAVISGNSPWIQERIRDVYGIDAGLLLPTVDLSKWGSNSDEIVENRVVTIGRASHVKGTWETINMLSGTNLALSLVGGGNSDDLRRIEKHAEKHGVELTIEPRLSDAELASLVRCSLAMVSLAYDEPFGLTPIEAQAAGTPALMVDEGGFRYTIEDGISGRLLPRGDWQVWHSALEKSRDLATRESWSKAGQANVMAMGLRPENQADSLANLFGIDDEE
tara:strand:+ start:62 stop:1249 length:1188 start_codon:yes stop_codon:yes gene_type:complete